MDFKIGDKVIYVSHCVRSTEIYRKDRENFNIGQIYTLAKKYGNIANGFIFEESLREVLSDQIIKAIDNNKLNKILYPDFIEYDKYLIPKETYETIAHKKE